MPKTDSDSMLQYSRKPNPTDAKTYYQTGNDYYERADYEKSIENYNMAILLNPVFSEAYFNRALSYYQLKNFEKSVADYTKSAELDPQNPIIYNNRGDAFYRKQDFQSAIKDYDKAITLNPNYLKAFYNRGLSYASLEEYEKAIEDFSKVVELKADFAEAYHLRGLAYEYAGNLSTAIADYEKALELNPNLTEAKTHLEGAKAKKEQEGKAGEGGAAGGDIKMLQKPNMTFVDVAGMDKMKEEIREAVVYPLINPELARRYGKLGGGGILMYGPPGCGKCVAGDTPVLLANGEWVAIAKLYEEAKRSGKIKMQSERGELIEMREAIEVYSLVENQIIRTTCNLIFRDRSDALIEIKTKSGRRVEVTPVHKLFVFRNGAIEEVMAQYLTSGEQIASATHNENEVEENGQLLKSRSITLFKDEIVSIICKRGAFDVFDLSLPGIGNFVAGFGGGLICHNTFIIKAAAGECKSGFINAKLSDLLDMYVGNTEKNIHKVFELARKNTPCMLFFDEVDAIGGRRDQQEGQQYMKMAVNQLLYEMDGVEANNQNVLTIAATNAPWDVDPALRRSGRFSKAIFIPEPDFKSRVAIIKLHAKKRPLSPGIPFYRLGIATYGYASADLKAVVEEAAAFPWREAFFAIQKKTDEYVKQGLAQKEAEERAKAEVNPRPLTVADFINAVRKKKSSLPPWYEQAKKQIGKQEEITVIDGKEHKKVTESKMGPGEKEAFKDLLNIINGRNQLPSKIMRTVIREFALLIPIPF